MHFSITVTTVLLFGLWAVSKQGFQAAIAQRTQTAAPTATYTFIPSPTATRNAITKRPLLPLRPTSHSHGNSNTYPNP